MVITKRIYFLIGIPLVLLAVSALLCSWLLWKNNQGSRHLINEIVRKQSLLLEIYYKAGYGGGIHHFKNFVLRKDLRYEKPARESFTDAIQSCDQYLSIGSINTEEIDSLHLMKRTFSEYLYKIDIVHNMIADHQKIEKIDQAVKVDDTQAIERSLKIRDLLETRRQEYVQAFNRNQINIFVLLGLLFIAIIGFSIFVTQTTRNRIQKSLEGAVKMARDVASGNYTPVVDADSADDLDSLCTDIQMMAGTIKTKIDVIQTSSTDLKQFAFIAAHDLREPVNKIMAYADLILLEDGNKLSDKTKNELQKIIKCSLKLAESTRDLLLYADLANTPRPHQMISLAECLAVALKKFEAPIQEHHIVVTADKLPPIQGGAKHFENLFENLISNSIKFRDPKKETHIHITCEKVNQAYQVSFKDNGIGFAQKFAESAIKPFVKLHDKHTYEGSGTGLAMCARILQIYDSRFVITSEVDKGTKFSFLISG